MRRLLPSQALVGHLADVWPSKVKRLFVHGSDESAFEQGKVTPMIRPGQRILLAGHVWEARTCYESQLDESLWWNCRREVGRWFGLFPRYAWMEFADELLCAAARVIGECAP